MRGSKSLPLVHCACQPNKTLKTIATASMALLLAAILVATFSGLQGTEALENGVARRPPMGWLAWERFTCEVNCTKYPHECIQQDLFLEMAQRLVDDRWLELGYEYVNIDDCWSEHTRDPRTLQLVPNATRFHWGLKRLADTIHGHQLKLGLYGDCGTKTCGGYPAQLNANDNASFGLDNYFQTDANTLSDWKIDSFKLDGCYIDPMKAESVCPLFTHYLRQTGRKILLTCEWPFYLMYAHQEPDYKLAAESCNMWRYYDDIEDSWQSILNTIDYTVKHQSTIVKYHGPGHWFDPDQLVIGNFGLSVGQARAQMALWCIWAAPLYMSNDLRKIEPQFVKILKNKQLIGLDQDRLGVFGLMTHQAPDSSWQVFVRPVEPIDERTGCPSFAVVYLNRATLGNRQWIGVKVRDFLRGAPILQAAINERAAIAWELEQNVTIAPVGQEAINELKRSLKPQVEKLRQVKVNKCLDWLEARPEEGGGKQEQLPAVENSLWSRPTDGSSFASGVQANIDSGAGAQGTKALRFEVTDLFEGNVLRALTLDDHLELRVDPSSVRVVKLQLAK